jgi:hypothetical protein
MFASLSELEITRLDATLNKLTAVLAQKS